MRQVYLDHNATTPLHPEVKQALASALDDYGNPSSMHEPGRHARRLVEEARAETAGFLGASPEEIIFVGSGSEGNNAVLNSVTCPARACESARCAARHHSGTGIVTTTIEHPCVLDTAKCHAEKGIKTVFVPVDDTGTVDKAALEAAITPQVALVSVMMANNEIGTLQDIASIAALAHEHGAMMHTDAVQAVGKIPVDVRELGVDFLTLSAHKIYGPKGVGAIYVRKGTPFCPLIHGGHQERGRRAGTENTLGIIGLGKAIAMRREEMDAEHTRLLGLKEMLRAGIEERIPDVRFNGHPTNSLPNTVNVSFEGAEGETILLYLDFEGVAVSTGSACASGSLDPSHVLLASHVPIESAHGSVRLSMGRGTTEEDIAYVLDVLPKTIERIRAMSTAYAAK